MELQDIYNKIASHFNNTRTYIWKGVKVFMDNIPEHSSVLDAGCGNGKNMYRDDINYIGFDFSIEMLKHCYLNGKKNLSINDIQFIPYRDNIFDYTLSVAVIHHLDSEKKMIRGINELVRVTKPSGKIFIQVWNKNKYLSNKFHHIYGNHYLVEWNNCKKSEKYMRYYYLFTLGDCLKLFRKVKFVLIKSVLYEKNNWIIILEKNN